MISVSIAFYWLHRYLAGCLASVRPAHRAAGTAALHHPPASYLSASIGSMDAARRAGYNAESTAIVPSRPVATSPDFHVGSNPAKKYGIGSRFTRVQMPYAPPGPHPPLVTAIKSASVKNCRREVCA